MANVRFKIESKGNPTLKNSAEMVFGAAIDGDETNVFVVGEQNAGRMVEALAHIVADVAEATGKGFEFVSVVSSIATAMLLKGDDE